MTRYHVTYKDSDTELIEAKDDTITDGAIIFSNVSVNIGIKHVVIPLCAIKKIEVVLDEPT